MFIPTGMDRVFENPAPFGDLVPKRFTSARNDIVGAAKCLALERYVACVLHLMRVLECGLKAMAVAADWKNQKPELAQHHVRHGKRNRKAQPSKTSAAELEKRRKGFFSTLEHGGLAGMRDAKESLARRGLTVDLGA